LRLTDSIECTVDWPARETVRWKGSHTKGIISEHGTVQPDHPGRGFDATP